jgi:hypothetical protein
MDSEEYYMEGGKKRIKHKFLGQGSYGCTVTPGLDCKGKTNKYAYKVNKIQEVNFNSKNEIEISNAIKKIKGYKKRFVPVLKSCIVKFNQIEPANDIVTSCKNENLFSSNIEDIGFIKNEYFMFYMKYIRGEGLKKYLLSSKTIDLFFDNFLNSLYYLLNSIYLLNKNKIVHNDLHYNNIMVETSTNTPFLIDFGLSFKYKSLFKNSYGIDYTYMRKYFFDWKDSMYWYLMEKKFISFIFDNHSQYFRSYVDSDYAENKLTKEIIDIFVNDVFNSFYNEFETKILFQENEFQEFFKVLKKFYYKFLPSNDKYKYYSNIIEELLPFVLKFNDLHSVTSSFIQIFYKKINKDINNNNNFYKYTFIYEFIKSLFKKVYYPDPNYRLSTYQFISIFSFVFKFCQNIHFENLKDKNYLKEFNISFKSLLNDLFINYDLFFDKNYSYIDFDLLLEKKNIILIKNLNFTIM